MQNWIVAKRKFSSQVNKTVCILANSKSSDIVAGRFMNNLKEVSGEKDFDFFGYGGENSQAEGLEDSMYDISNFLDKAFHTYRKTNVWREEIFYRYHFFNWINKHYSRHVDTIYESFTEHEIPKKIYHARPSLIFSFDNEYMTFRLHDDISRFYENNTLPRPARHYHNRFVRDFRQWTQKYVDYMHYSIPLLTDLAERYRFPAQYVGQYGVYDALRHLMQNNEATRHLVRDKSILLSRDYFAADLERVINSTRASFREKHGIPENATLIFFAPGNEASEASFSLESTRKGVREFLLKYSAPTSLSPIAAPLENFYTVISLKKGSSGEEYVKKHTEEEPFYGNVIFVSDEGNEHVDAMAASDVGIVYDGQVVGQAAACHLPTMILLEMRMHHQWYHDLFNRWWNNMVIIADNNIYPEFIGSQAWYGKICDTLGEWYLKPGIRWDMVRKWEPFVKEALPRTGFTEVPTGVTDAIVLSDGAEYHEFSDPFNLMARKAWVDIQGYDMRGYRAGGSQKATLKTRIPDLY